MSIIQPEFNISNFDVNKIREKRVSELFNSLQEAKKRVISGISREEFVFTTNSHEFPLLLKMWLMKNKGGFFRNVLNFFYRVRVNDEKQKIIAQTLKHEYSHSFPVVGYSEAELQVRYGLVVSLVGGGLEITPAVEFQEGDLNKIDNIYSFLTDWFEGIINPALEGQELSSEDILAAANILELCSQQSEMLESVLPIFKLLPAREKELINKQRQMLQK